MENIKLTEIYYFSGTGNSLHVARELQKRIPQAKLIPIVSLVSQESVTTEGEKVSSSSDNGKRHCQTKTDGGILASTGPLAVLGWAGRMLYVIWTHRRRISGQAGGS